MNRIGAGKVLTGIGVMLFILLFFSYLRDGGGFGVGLFFSLWVLVPGIACWASGRRKLSEVKRRLSLIEDTIRRTKSRAIERGFEEKTLVSFDSARTEISNLYLKPKYGGRVNKHLANIEEAASELEGMSGSKSLKDVRYQMSVLNDRIADLRSELRR